MTRIIGLSPKLYPTVLGVVIGVGLLALGEHRLGVGVLAAGAMSLVGGYALPAGHVVAEPTPGLGSPHADAAGEGSDTRLATDVLAHIASESGAPLDDVVKAVGGVVSTVGAVTKGVGGILGH